MEKREENTKQINIDVHHRSFYRVQIHSIWLIEVKENKKKRKIKREKYCEKLSHC